METVAATDGSALGNPGPGGWAWVTEDGREGSAAATYTTNNRMELRAVLELLRAVDKSETLVIQSDSAYVIGVFTEWLDAWRRRGMRTSRNAPVENQDLIEVIAQELEGRQVRFEKIPGHAGHRLNALADARAQEWARLAAQKLAGGASTSRRGRPPSSRP
jgi:ribonuclease HI